MISAALAVLENEGQREELSEFYEKYKKRLLNIAFSKLHNREEAEDAVQEAFLKIADRPDIFFSLNETERRRYISGVIKNVAVDLFNKKQKDRAEELTDDIVYLNDEAPVENSLFDNISRNEIIAFIDTLPETQKAVLVLSYLSGLSADEIGRVLGIPVTAVYKRLYSARNAIKRFVDERRKNNV